MDKIEINFAVCQYMPDVIRQEKINVGLAVHCPTPGNEYSEFIHIKNRRRISMFDDEYDSDFVTLMFENLKYQLNYSSIGHEDLFSNGGVNEFVNINSNDFLSEKLKYYVNEFKFLPVQKIYTTNKDMLKDLEDLEKTYLYYERPKNERISTKEVKNLLSKQIKNMNLNKSFSDSKIKDFDEDKVFDYQYNNILIKSFSFDNNKYGSFKKELKSFLFDLDSNMNELNNMKIRLIVNNDFKASVSYNEQVYCKLIDYKNLNIEVTTLADYTTSLMVKGIN
ncbi:DUF3037 domain-containing protein [Carnobacterium divergens]|uniref:DUF3037 domain-containing protein n=1 Tax=Carnobacterium divergens TaxID=2748 RepID=UPI0039C95D1C